LAEIITVFWELCAPAGCGRTPMRQNNAMETDRNTVSPLY
jgi:hypothetical protein